MMPPLDPQRWEEIQATFDALVELDARERSTRLAALGVTDPPLHAALETLLAADAAGLPRLAPLDAAFFSPITPAHDPANLAGRTVSHFRVLEPLGAGGMGVVYRAEDTRLGRAVALKFLLPESSLDGSAKARFLREAHAAAALDHPNLCTVYEVGESEDGRLFLAMALYAGETLMARLAREGPLAVGNALEIVRQIAQGLGCAHAAGIVHRDLKPGNVMLLPDGSVKILDFGLAKTRDASLSDTGARLGTVAYMAPEQIRGRPVDARADLWALGIVLYEMLTGRKPFGGEDAVAIAHAIVHDEPVAPSSLRDGLPAAVDHVVLALLQKDPRKRYPTVAELITDLAKVGMIVGAREHAIQARRQTDPVPPLRTGRGTVPAHVEQAIETALPKVPADPFLMPIQFGEVLASSVPAKAAASSRRWARWAVGGTGLALAGTLAALLVTSSGGTAPLASNLLAVAPFDVRGGSVGSWREGLVEYLSRSLDGAGDIQTVSPSVFVRSWSGLADPASARALGRRTGAGLVVFGSVVQGERDSVRLRVTLLDAVHDRSLGEVEIRGDTLAIDQLADSLAVALLRELGRTRPVGAIRNAPFGTASLSGLKEFLRGERFYRRSQYDSALAHHAHAIKLDSTFALAYRRMALDLGWGPSTSHAYEPPETYAFKAASLNHGLAQRDSLLIVADSMFNALAHGNLSEDASYALLRRLHGVLDETARRFPGELEVWQAIGETDVHLDPSGTPADALRAFDRAIALDSGFTPAYQHVLGAAVQIGGADLARPYVRAILSLRVMDAPNRLAALLLDPDRARSQEVTRFIDTAPVQTLFSVGMEHLGAWADSGEIALRLLHAMTAGQRSVAGAEGWVADTAMWPQYVAGKLLYRGRAREAYQVYRQVMAHPPNAQWAWFANPFVDLAVVNAVPRETVSAVIARSPASGSSWHRWLSWWYAQRNTAALTGAVHMGDSAARRAGSSVDRARAGSWRSAATAYLALIHGDSVAAIQDLQTMADTLCECPMEQLVLAQLLAARGDDAEAARIIDRWLWIGPRPTFVLARLERARIAERSGDRDLAREWYQYVTEVWRNADPELQPFVAQAHAGLRRLPPDWHTR